MKRICDLRDVAHILFAFLPLKMLALGIAMISRSTKSQSPDCAATRGGAHADSEGPVALSGAS